MAVDFSKFDKQINKEELAAQEAKAKENNFEPLPDGEYICSLTSMEVKETKAGDKLMLSAGFTVKEGKYTKRMLWLNQNIFGTKNDGFGIMKAKEVLTAISGEEVEFTTYSEFAEEVLDIFQDFAGSIEVKVEQYQNNGYTNLRIKDVYDI